MNELHKFVINELHKAFNTGGRLHQEMRPEHRAGKMVQVHRWVRSEVTEGHHAELMRVMMGAPLKGQPHQVLHANPAGAVMYGGDGHLRIDPRGARLLPTVEHQGGNAGGQANPGGAQGPQNPWVANTTFDEHGQVRPHIRAGIDRFAGNTNERENPGGGIHPDIQRRIDAAAEGIRQLHAANPEFNPAAHEVMMHHGPDGVRVHNQFGDVHVPYAKQGDPGQAGPSPKPWAESHVGTGPLWWTPNPDHQKGMQELQGRLRGDNAPLDRNAHNRKVDGVGGTNNGGFAGSADYQGAKDHHGYEHYHNAWVKHSLDGRAPQDLVDAVRKQVNDPSRKREHREWARGWLKAHDEVVGKQ